MHLINWNIGRGCGPLFVPRSPGDFVIIAPRGEGDGVLCFAFFTHGEGFTRSVSLLGYSRGEWRAILISALGECERVLAS